MRVLVAPDKFAGTLTAVEAAEAIADGLARGARRTTSWTWRRWPTAGPGFVDVLHASLGGELLAVTVRGPYGEPVPARCCWSTETAYVESAQACGLHLTERRGRRARDDVRRRRAGRGRGRRRRDHGRGRARRQRHQRRRRRPAGRARRDRRRARSTQGGAGLDGVTTVDLARPGRGSGRAAGRGQRRGQPADRAVRRHQDLRPAEGHRRGAARRCVDGWLEQFAAAAGPPRRAREGRRRGRRASASRCCCSAPPASRASTLVADAVGLADAGRARPTWWSPARAPSTSPAGPARCRTASPRSPPRRCGRASPWPARCWSARGRCARWASSRRTPWSTWWGRSARSPTRPAPGRPRRAGGPHLVALTRRDAVGE